MRLSLSPTAACSPGHRQPLQAPRATHIHPWSVVRAAAAQIRLGGRHRGRAEGEPADQIPVAKGRRGEASRRQQLEEAQAWSAGAAGAEGEGGRGRRRTLQPCAGQLHVQGRERGQTGRSTERQAEPIVPFPSLSLSLSVTSKAPHWRSVQAQRSGVCLRMAAVLGRHAGERKRERGRETDASEGTGIFQALPCASLSLCFTLSSAYRWDERGGRREEGRGWRCSGRRGAVRRGRARDKGD